MDKKLPSIIKHCKYTHFYTCGPCGRLSIYTKAKNNTMECNIHEICVPKNTGFEKTKYTGYNGGLYYHSYYKDRPSIIEQCYHEQENIF